MGEMHGGGGGGGGGLAFEWRAQMLSFLFHRLKVPEKLQVYGLYVHYVVHICDFGMLRVKDVPHLILCATWPRRPSGYNSIPILYIKAVLVPLLCAELECCYYQMACAQNQLRHVPKAWFFFGVGRHPGACDPRPFPHMLRPKYALLNMHLYVC